MFRRQNGRTEHVDISKAHKALLSRLGSLLLPCTCAERCYFYLILQGLQAEGAAHLHVRKQDGQTLAQPIRAAGSNRARVRHVHGPSSVADWRWGAIQGACAYPTEIATIGVGGQFSQVKVEETQTLPKRNAAPL